MFATWAYAWTLVAITGTGVGLFLQGTVTDRAGVRTAGVRLAAAGAVLFVLGAIFFEGVVGLSGLGSGPAAHALAPALLIAIGVAVLAWSRIRGARAPQQGGA